MDRDFLFGVIAVQLGQASPAQVMAAASAFVADRSRSIPDRLRQQGVFDDDRFRMIESMVDDAVKAHGGDVRKTIQTLGGSRVLLSSFGGSLVQNEAGGLSVVSRTTDSTEDTLAVTPETPGRYRSEGNELGRGGIGRVLVAFDEHLGREVALKELLPDVSGSQSGGSATKTGAAAARFLREARVTGQLEHPNIIPVYELGLREDGTYYYAMKMVRGRTLSEALSACRTPADRLLLLSHYVDLCNAIGYAHSRGVIHRDIKPDNVMLGEFGETVVVDWGLAKVAGKKDIRGGDLERDLRLLHDKAAGQTVDGSAIGTPAYMSPEQADGAIDDIDERSDVWSLGAVLYEILTGRPPFEGVSPFEIIGKVLKDNIRPCRQVEPTVPSELAAVCEKALERDKTARYETAKGLAAEVEAFMSGARIRAYDYSSWELVQRFVARNRALSGTIGLVVALVIGSTISLIAAYGRSEEARAEAVTERKAAERSRDQALRARKRSDVQSLTAKAAVDAQLGGVSEAAAQLRAALELEGELGESETSSKLLLSRLDRLAAAGGLSKLLPNVGGQSLQLAFSPNGKTLLSAGDNGAIRLRDTESGRVVVIAKPGGNNRPTNGVFAADGNAVVTCSVPDALQVWDHATGAMTETMGAEELGGKLSTVTWDVALFIAVIKPHRCAPVISAKGETYGALIDSSTIALWDVGKKDSRRTIVPGGKVIDVVQPQDRRQLLLLTEDGTVHRYHIPSGEAAGGFSTKLRDATILGMSPDGRLVIVATKDRLEVWNVEQKRRTMKADGSYSSAAIAGTGDQLVAGSKSKAHLWDIQSGQQLWSTVHQKGSVFAVAFTPDGSLVVTTSQGLQTITGWDSNSGAKVWTSVSGIVDRLAFSRDGSLMAAISADGARPSLWRYERDRMAWRQRVEDRIYDFAWSPDGSMLVSACRNGSAHVWNGKSGKLLKVLPTGKLAATHTAFTRDGSRFAVSAYDGGVRVYEASSLRLMVSHALEGQVFNVAFSPDDRWLAAADFMGNAAIWGVDGKPGTALPHIPGHGSWRVRFTKAPNNAIGYDLVTHGWDNRLVVRRLPTGDIAYSDSTPSGLSHNLTVAPETGLAASGSESGELVIWNLGEKGQLHRIKAHDGQIWHIETDATGQKLLTASRDGTAKVWDFATGKRLSILEGHEDELRTCAFSPNGELAATTSLDDTMRVWRIATGERLHTFPIETGSQAMVHFSPDGKRVATSNNAGELTVWHVDPSRDVTEVIETTGRETNARVCQETHEVVHVLPFPAATSIWAPKEACRP